MYKTYGNYIKISKFYKFSNVKINPGILILDKCSFFFIHIILPWLEKLVLKYYHELEWGG